MIRIALISDTHGFVHERVLNFIKDCDEIWHAGDIGNFKVIEDLQNIAPVKAVYGNIDSHELRLTFPKYNRFMCEGVDVLITHIGGYPGRYESEARLKIVQNPPDIFICGHSHILKVINDKKYNLLHINPGAAGKYGFHVFITAIRFVIDGKNIKDLEILEISR